MGTESILYRIINPSDPYTFRAEDDKIAVAAVIVLGKGQYDVERFGNDGSLGALLAFMLEADVEERLVGLFGEGGLKDFLNANLVKIAEALESVACVNSGERFLYERAMSFMDEEARIKYRDEVHSKFRTSMNDIGARAWALAEAHREAAAIK